MKVSRVVFYLVTHAVNENRMMRTQLLSPGDVPTRVTGGGVLLEAHSGNSS